MGSIRQAELRNKILHFLKNIKYGNSIPEYCSYDNQPGLDVDVRSPLGVVLVPVQPVVHKSSDTVWGEGGQPLYRIATAVKLFGQTLKRTSRLGSYPLIWSQHTQNNQ